MGVKKILSLAAVLAGVYFIGRSTAPDLGEVIDYVNAHPQHQEIVLNRTMYNREKRKLDYSAETLGNFSRALLYEFRKDKFHERDNEINPNPKSQSSEFGDAGNLNKNSASIAQLKKYLYDLVLDTGLGE
jgi:hypothetical protein